MFETAKDWAVAAGVSPYEPDDFDALGSKRFLEQYCHVVFSINFSVCVVHKYEADTARAFMRFNLKKLAETDRIDLSTVPIKNKMKIDWFLSGAKELHAEGFHAFKERVKSGGIDELKSLKGIGDVTKRHLAMIIGLQDTAKDDRWLIRCACACGADVDSFVEFLVAEFGLPKWHIDGTLWEYCRQNKQIPPTAKTR